MTADLTIVAIYADSADWPAPGWYSGELTIDPNMDSHGMVLLCTCCTKTMRHAACASALFYGHMLLEHNKTMQGLFVLFSFYRNQ